MIIGSTNSLTYQHPQSWWKHVIGWYNKHQEVDYEIQYKFYGVRLFNLKLYVDKGGHIVIRSGNTLYPISSFYEILDYFNKMGDVTLLITLEETFEDERIEKKFYEHCNIIETIYKDIMLCGGYREFDKKQIYRFNWQERNNMPKIMAPDDWSVVYKFVQRWCPFLIRKLNKYYIERYKDFKGFLMLSYVNRK